MNFSSKELLAEARNCYSTDLPAAISYCEAAIAQSVEIQDEITEAEARHLLAQFCFTKSDYNLALEHIQHAIRIREALGDSAKVSVSLNSLGIFLSAIGDYPQSLDAYFRSLKIKEELGDMRGKATTLLNIGSVYQWLGNLEHSMQMYEESLELASELGDEKLITSNHMNIGQLHVMEQRYEMGLSYLEGIVEKLLSLGDKGNALKALNSLGYINKNLNQPHEALQKYLQGYELSEGFQFASGMIVALNNIAEIKMKLGDIENAQHDLETAVALARQYNEREYLKDAKQILSELFEQTGEYQKALEAYREHTQLKDELKNVQSLKKLGDLQLKYDLDKKDKEAEIFQLKHVALKDAMDKLNEEKQRSESLLLNILPEEVAEELKVDGLTKARYYDSATVMFIDIKNFTQYCEGLSPEEIVKELDFLFGNFDAIVERHGVEKIKTIGDAYLCAAGVPKPNERHAHSMLNAAMDIAQFVQQQQKYRVGRGQTFFSIRTGIHSGPLVAGVVGSSKFAYDIWGDTVNTAARMEQSGEVGRINVSQSTFELLQHDFSFEARGLVKAKNKGEIMMYFLQNKLA